MFKEFKTFVMRGNVMDLAIAVIIGAAFGRIVSSLTDDVIMPLIGKVFGGLDFASHFIILNPEKVPPALAGSTDYAALKKAGVPLLGYGEFVTQAVNFLIVALIIFLMIRAMNRLAPKPEEVAAGDPADVVLLREIRDELKKRNDKTWGASA